MEIKQFEQMIRCSNLSIICTLPIHLRFFVSYRTKTGRAQTDVLAFGRDEFEVMTAEQARTHIQACEARLERASKTKQGVVAYEGGKALVATKPVVHFTSTAINYPAH